MQPQQDLLDIEAADAQRREIESERATTGVVVGRKARLGRSRVASYTVLVGREGAGRRGARRLEGAVRG